MIADPTLRRDAQERIKMLEAHDQAGSFLETASAPEPEGQMARPSRRRPSRNPR